MKNYYQKPQADVFEVYSVDTLLEELSGGETDSGTGTPDNSRSIKEVWESEND